MTQPLTPQPENLDRRRQITIDLLSAHFALDHLPMEELERRMELTYIATTPGELQALTADLPVLEAETPKSSAAVARSGGRHEHRRKWAVLSGFVRRGVWVPPRRLNIVAFMGGAELDFREAVMPNGEVMELHITAVMGGVQITVPPEMRVEDEGFGIMGAFDQCQQPGAPGGPVLRISGFAFMGGVSVQVSSAPGEAPERRLPGG